MLMRDDPTRTRDAFADCALILLGTPTTAILALLAVRLSPQMSVSRPEVALSIALACAAALLLAWNILSLLLAHLASLAPAPLAIRRGAARLVTRFGTDRARRLLMRTSTSALLSVGIVAAVGTASFAQPRGDAAQSDDATSASSVLWTASPSNADTPSMLWSPTGALRPTEDAARGTETDEAASSEVSDGPVKPASAHTVQPGECLWTIAADSLGPGASPHEITDAWQNIYRANDGLIGVDPDLIHPGLVLTIPEEAR